MEQQRTSCVAGAETQAAGASLCRNAVSTSRELSSNVISFNCMVVTRPNCLHLKTDERETPAAEKTNGGMFSINRCLVQIGSLTDVKPRHGELR